MQVAVAYDACMSLITQGLAHWMGRDTPHTHSNRSILRRSTHLSRKKIEKKLGKSLKALLIAVICLITVACLPLNVVDSGTIDIGPSTGHSFAIVQGDTSQFMYDFANQYASTLSAEQVRGICPPNAMMWPPCQYLIHRWMMAQSLPQPCTVGKVCI